MGLPTPQTPYDAWLSHPAIGVDPNMLAGGEAPAAATAAEPASIGAKPSLTFNDTLESPEFAKWDSGYLKGGFKVKGSLKGELASRKEGAAASEGYTTNKGVKGDSELARDVGKELFATLRVKDNKVTLNHELSNKQIKLSLQLKINFESRVSWLAPVFVVEFTVGSIEWEKFRENPDNYTIGGLEAGGGVKGSGTIKVNEGWDAKLAVELTATGTVKPNWPKILLEIAERYGVQAGATAGGAAAGGSAAGGAAATTGAAAAGAESVAVGGTGTAGAAAVGAASVAGIAGGIVGGVALCAAAMKAIAVLGEQGRDSTACVQEGARRLRAYADSYAATVRGRAGSQAEGNRDGEAHLKYIMRTAQTTREDAVAMCLESDQKYEQIAWAALRPKMRDAVKKAYDQLHWGGIADAPLLEFLGDNSDY